MYLRAGMFSLGLLLLSRLLGLLRESAQAAAFGSSGLGDAVIVMFTLPDLLVGIAFSGALSYVLLPLWAGQDPVQRQASQARVAVHLALWGVALAGAVWWLRDLLVQALAPGLRGQWRALSASSLAWSAVVLPMSMLAALWVTRLQHERDFIGMYAGSLAVNIWLIAGLLAVASLGWSIAMPALGGALVLGALTRLAWLYWRLPADKYTVMNTAPACATSNHDVGGGRHAACLASSLPSGLPGASVWLWAALSSGLLMVLPVMARSLASQAGEGALAQFNYAWKLIELPLVLAIQLVASLAFPAIARTVPASAERRQALHVAFVMAWGLACAAVVVVALFALPLARLLFGWGRMSDTSLDVIAQWSAAGAWSLLPQALIAVVLTVMATAQQLHLAVWAYAAGIVALALAGWLGLTSGSGSGLGVMWLLDAVLAGVALLLLASQRKTLAGALPAAAMLAPLSLSLLLVWVIGPRLSVPGVPAAVGWAALFATLVLASAVLASAPLRTLAGTWLRASWPLMRRAPHD